MNSIITLMDSSSSIGFSENNRVVSLRKGSDYIEDDGPLEDFFVAIDFLGVKAVGAFFCGKDLEAVVADG